MQDELDYDNAEPHRRALVVAIRDTVADDASALKIVDYWMSGEPELKTGALAEHLDMTIPEFYRAKKLIEYRAAKCADAMGAKQ